MTKKQSKPMGKHVSKQVGPGTMTNADAKGTDLASSSSSLSTARIRGADSAPEMSADSSASRKEPKTTHASSSSSSTNANAESQPASRRRHQNSGTDAIVEKKKGVDDSDDGDAAEKKEELEDSAEKKQEQEEEEDEEDEEDEEADDPTAALFLPFYLQRFVQHYHNEVFVTPYCDKRVVSQLMVEGFLPIATQDYVLPKLHRQRCVMTPDNLHIPKSTKKKAKRFQISINQDFEGVVAGCHRQHGTNWLYEHITEAFRQIHASGTTGIPAFVFPAHVPPSLLPSPEDNGASDEAAAGDKDNDDDENGDQGHKHGMRRKRPSPSSSSASSSSSRAQSRRSSASRKQRRAPSPDQQRPKHRRDPNQPLGTTPVRLYSVEVYNAETDELVAGELGYTVGDIYTSLTGFSCQDSAGSVQLSALGVLLRQQGFGLWDLGMYMAYKEKMGAALMPRVDFVQRVSQARSMCCTPTDPSAALAAPPPPVRILQVEGKRNCKDILSA